MKRREAVIKDMKAKLNEEFDNFILIGVKDGNIYTSTTYPKWAGEAQFIVSQTNQLLKDTLATGWDIPDELPDNVVPFKKKS